MPFKKGWNNVNLNEETKTLLDLTRYMDTPVNLFGVDGNGIEFQVNLREGCSTLDRIDVNLSKGHVSLFEVHVTLDERGGNLNKVYLY